MVRRREQHIPLLCTDKCAQRKLRSLEFLKGSTDAISPFCLVRAVAKPDRIYKRLKMEIFDEKTSEKLASCYGKRRCSASTRPRLTRL